MPLGEPSRTVIAIKHLDELVKQRQYMQFIRGAAQWGCRVARASMWMLQDGAKFRFSHELLWCGHVARWAFTPRKQWPKKRKEKKSSFLFFWRLCFKKCLEMGFFFLSVRRWADFTWLWLFLGLSISPRGMDETRTILATSWYFILPQELLLSPNEPWIWTPCNPTLRLRVHFNSCFFGGIKFEIWISVIDVILIDTRICVIYIKSLQTA